MEIAAGYDPSSAVWDNDRMRKHLIQCFEQNRMSRFPIQLNKMIPLGRHIKHSTSEGTYCVCQMPNNEAKPMISVDFVTDGFMVNVFRWSGGY